MQKIPFESLPGGLGNNLGEYLKDQRQQAKLSLRQLSSLAGISNPYLSQIERGVKRPSADILQQIAKGLSISAETLYVQAGLLDPKDAAAEAGATTRAAIRNDPALTARQRQSLLEIYESFVGGGEEEGEPARPTPRAKATQREARKGVTEKKAAQKATPARKTSAKASSTRSTTRASGTKSTTTSASTSKRATARKQTSGTRKGADSTASSTTRDARS